MIVTALNIAIVFLALLCFVYSRKLYLLTREKSVLWILLTSAYGLVLRTLFSMQILSAEMTAVLMFVFWMLLTSGIYGMYRVTARYFTRGKGGKRL